MVAQPLREKLPYLTTLSNFWNLHTIVRMLDSRVPPVTPLNRGETVEPNITNIIGHSDRQGIDKGLPWLVVVVVVW